MNYIIFNEFNGNYSLLGIRETETTRYLEDYLYVYVDKTAEEIESDGITAFGLPETLPSYVIMGLRERLKPKLVEYVNILFKQLTSHISDVEKLLLPKLVSQADSYFDNDAGINRQDLLLERVAELTNNDVVDTANNIMAKAKDSYDVVYTLLRLEIIVTTKITSATTIEAFFDIWNELNNYDIISAISSMDKYREGYIAPKQIKNKRKAIDN